MSDVRYLHPALKVTRTLTGRLATSGFPVLGIPKHSEEGRRIRSLLVAPAGWLVYEADYSQIELRTAAELSGDTNLIKAYKAGIDIHAQTAHEVLGAPKDRKLQDESKHRLPAKTGNFSMLMGTSEMGLTSSIHKAGNLAWSKDCAGCKSFKAPHASNCDSVRFMREWFRVYSGVRQFMDDRRDYGEAHGKAYGMWGEEWSLPGCWSPHEDVREQTLRQTHALPVQSGAQRLIKLAMGRVYEVLRRWRGRVNPTLQVHDSLLFLVRRDVLQSWHACVIDSMQNIATWKVPIIADAKAGPSWLAMEKV